MSLLGKGVSHSSRLINSFHLEQRQYCFHSDAQSENTETSNTVSSCWLSAHRYVKYVLRCLTGHKTWETRCAVSIWVCSLLLTIKYKVSHKSVTHERCDSPLCSRRIIKRASLRWQANREQRRGGKVMPAHLLHNHSVWSRSDLRQAKGHANILFTLRH